MVKYLIRIEESVGSIPTGSTKMVITSKKLGILGEKIALKYLRDKKYQILDKNYSEKFISGPKRGEIDIVAKKKDVISFIEVKTLLKKNQTPNQQKWTRLLSPEDKVNFQKQRKLIKLAQSWLIEKKIPLDVKWQIDVISIGINFNSKKAKIRHIQNTIED